MITTGDLVNLARLFSDNEGQTLATVGTYAANDGKFFRNLEAGGGCTLSTAARVVNWFDAYWPEDLEWPRDIPRPSLKPKHKEPQDAD